MLTFEVKSKENTLLIESVQSGFELNFPAYSLFELNNIILGYNPEPFTNGKFSPITKINFYKIKIPHYLRQAEIKSIPTNLQPNESLNIDDSELLNNPNSLSFYLILKKKKLGITLVKIENIKIHNTFALYLFEIMAYIEDYIDYLRKAPDLAPDVDFAEKFRSFIISNLKLKDCIGWPKHRTYEYPNSFPINFISFFSYLSMVSINNMINENCPIYVFFEKDKFNQNQIFIILDKKKHIDLISNFLDGWKNNYYSSFKTNEKELEIIKHQNSEKVENFVLILDELYEEIQKDFQLRIKNFSKADELKNKINKVLDFFNCRRSELASITAGDGYYNRYDNFFKKLMEVDNR